MPFDSLDDRQLSAIAFCIPSTHDLTLREIFVKHNNNTNRNDSANSFIKDSLMQ